MDENDNFLDPILPIVYDDTELIGKHRSDRDIDKIVQYEDETHLNDSEWDLSTTSQVNRAMHTIKSNNSFIQQIKINLQSQSTNSSKDGN